MNLNLLRRSLADRRISIAVYALSVAAYGIMILAIWPTMQQNLSLLDELWQSYPEGLREAFGGETVIISSFDGFLVLEYFTNMWLIVMIAFCISIGSAAIAAEIERGTMELVLAQPISRRAVLVTKHLFFEVGVLLLIAATLIPIALVAPLVAGDLSYLGLLALAVPSFLFFTAIGSVTFFFSALFSSRGRAIFASLGLVIFSYALDIVANISDTVDKVHFLSLFNYWDPYSYLHSVDFAWGDLAVLAGITLVSVAAAVQRFERRDIAV